MSYRHNENTLGNQVTLFLNLKALFKNGSWAMLKSYLAKNEEYKR
jgi:hypothetical protein